MPTIAAVVVCAVSCVVCIIGLAIPYWVYSERGGYKVHAGLWSICRNKCSDYPSSNNLPDSLMATRAMEILGVLLVGGAVVLAVLKLIVMKDKTVLLKVAGILAVIAGAFMILGTIIYAAKFKKDYNDGADLHAGFALCIISGIGSIVGGVLFFVSRE